MVNIFILYFYYIIESVIIQVKVGGFMSYLEKNRVKEWLDCGKGVNATHMIVTCDKWDYSYSPHYVRPGERVDSVIDELLKYQSGGMIGICGIYNYDLDLESQLKETSPNHREPSIKYKTTYDLALEYATKKHEGKFRKGYDHKPYITHPIAVSNIVSKYMKNDSELETYKIAALLHDTLEDSDATYEEEKELFGKKIADIVAEVTNDKEEKNRLGKDVYLANKMTFMKEKTLILKLSDRYHNVSELIYDSSEFNEKYVRETIYIINYIMLYRNLNETHLEQINDIMKKIKEVSIISPMIIEPRKKTLKLDK